MSDVVTVTTTETATGTVTSVQVATVAEQGPVGPQGPQGETGPQGPAGADSTVPGPKGDTGDTGPAGAAGADGASAYEVWLDAGNTGSEADFLASLVGPQGVKGDTGDTGPQGPQGEQGPAGPAGADSTVPGPAGADGLSITTATIDGSGHLILTLSDASTVDAGVAKGADGATGATGADGVSVTGASIDGSGHLILTLSSGATVDAGVAKGADGTNGTNGTDGADGLSVTAATIDASGHLILTLSNASTIDAGVAKGADGAPGADGADGLGVPTPSFPTDEGKVPVARAASSGYALEAVAGGSSTLDGLTDVTVTTPADGHVLTYDGSGWVNEAPTGGGVSVLNRSTTLVTVESTTGETDLYRHTLAAGALGTGRTARLTLYGDWLHNTSGNYVVRVYLGATAVLVSSLLTPGSAGPNRRKWRLEALVTNAGAADSQVVAANLWLGNASTDSFSVAGGSNGLTGGGVGCATSAVDTSASVDVAVTVQPSLSSVNLSVRALYGMLELLP